MADDIARRPLVGPPRRDLRGLFGRADLIRAVQAASSPPGSAVALVGIGGVGKTRVATAVAEDWPERVVVVDIQAATTDEDVERALCAALALSDPRPDALAAHLRHLGRALVVLDAAEQVVEPLAAALAEWRAAAPAACWVVTSRRPLPDRLVVAIPVPPLPIPDDPAEAATCAAGRVFAACAPRGWAPEDAPPDVLRDVLAGLDGLPLALELAAARLEVMDLVALRDRLRDQLMVLVARPRRNGRQDALHTVLTDAWDLLDAEEQAALLGCSAFSGAFALRDAEEVLGSGVPGANPPLDALHGLVQKQLLVFDGARFHLLESIRAFAHARLGEAGRREAWARHRAWCLRTARAQIVVGFEGEAAFARIGAVQGEWIAAMRRADDPDEAAELMEVLAARLDVFGPTRPALVLVEERIAALRASTRGPGAAAPPPAGPDRLARLLLFRSRWLRRVGRIAEARAACAEARAIAVDDAVVSEALIEEAVTHVTFGESDAPGPLLLAALAHARAAGRLDHESRALACLALVTLDQGDRAGADAQLVQALAHARAIGDTRLVGNALSQQATIALEQLELASAERLIREALPIYTTLGDQRKVGVLNGNLGYVLAMQGRRSEAARSLEVAIATLAGAVDPVFAAMYTGYLGQVRLLDGEGEAAHGLLRDAVDRLTAAGEQRVSPSIRLALVAERALAGDLDVARAEAAQLDPATAPRICALLPATFAAGQLLKAPPGAAPDAVAAWLAEVSRAAAAVDPDEPNLRDLAALLHQVTAHRRAAWTIALDGGWFAPPGGARVPIGGTSAPARVLARLVDARKHEPGEVVRGPALAAAGWPGERLLPASAANRVRVAIYTLRRAGLAEVVERAGDGWRISPGLPVLFTEGPPLS